MTCNYIPVRPIISWENLAIHVEKMINDIIQVVLNNKLNKFKCNALLVL